MEYGDVVLLLGNSILYLLNGTGSVHFQVQGGGALAR